jgi:hypothetical protein
MLFYFASFLISSLFVSESFVSLVNEGELDTSGGEETDDGFFAFSNDENVVDSGWEVMVGGVLDVGNIEGTGMLLDVLEDTYSTNIVTSNDGNWGTVFELDESVNFSSLKVKLYKEKR